MHHVPSATFRRWLMTILILCLTTRSGISQAYCALRDPQTEIRSLYPDASSHLSLIRTVDSGARQRIRESVGLELHFNELGRHTLYAVHDGLRPVGLVHARSEQGRWGLLEIVWSLDLDLRVRDFRFQRCRDASRKALEEDLFREQLRGMRLDEMRELLVAGGSRLDPGGIDVPEGAEELAAVLVRCGLKTLAVTQFVWAEDLARLRLSASAHTDFPAAESLGVTSLLFEGETLDALLERGFEAPPESRTRSSSVTPILGEADKVLGVVVRTTLPSCGNLSTLWTLDTHAVIRSVRPEGGWPDEQARAAFEGMTGENWLPLSHCMTGTGVLASEMQTAVSVWLREGS